ncbi:MAG: agmatinase [Elusimicrobia bacterium GWD2_63_28]|nr:MAG: agmatinase [Elusimicrobia bacterium GWD2_63_28]OGR79990.1 MAG: agmatinase [Elusimicrobia bacterium GWC2_61_25]
MIFKPAKKQFMFGELRGPEGAAFTILPVPYEKTVSYGKGTAKGPAAVIDASWQLELWDEETKAETCRRGIFTASPVNCALPEAKFFPSLEKTVEGLLSSAKSLPFFIGGEHSITQALLPPFIRRHKNLSILHFDAHADLRVAYHGSRHSHACAVYPASRTNRVVQVGIRSVGLDEKQYHNAGNVITHLMHENLDMAKLERDVLRELTDTVYLTIDADGFDPSVMPGTGTPQPGGFGWYEALKLFKAVCKKKKVVGVDLVEVAPVRGSNISELTAAKLVYRLMGYLS